jgi:predicted dehydrogenase
MPNVPRVGFVGVGWIGRQRMEVAQASGALTVAGLVDPSAAALASALESAPGARTYGSLEAMLASEPLDGLVIATPSALHAPQAIQALERGVAVFCQKPLARTAGEAAAVVEAARRADRLLGVDLSYRHLAAARAVREVVRTGRLGRVFAGRLVFHNAYGPDKPWFYDLDLAGGGCVMDLGTHLVDLALWLLDWPAVTAVTGRCWAAGEPLDMGSASRVEDFAVARLDLAGGTALDLACSWRLHAGCDAEIEASFWGTEGGVTLRNVGGSFYDFRADHFVGGRRDALVSPPDLWGGRALVAWARQLAREPGFDPAAAELVEVARLVDRIYGREGDPPGSLAPAPTSQTRQEVVLNG